MTVGFVNHEIALTIKSSDTAALQILEEIEALGCPQGLYISTQIHVTRANAEQLVAKFKQLRDLGVVSPKFYADRVNQYNALMTHYLRTETEEV